MFLCDHAEFAQPLPRFSNWGKRIADAGENPVGKIFLKNSTAKMPDGTIGKTFGIAGSGKTIRKTPLALAGVGLAGYGTYRAKKVYDKYKPEIKMGRKIMRNYNALKNRFGGGDE